jgi:hypothetical protein
MKEKKDGDWGLLVQILIDSGLTAVCIICITFNHYVVKCCVSIGLPQEVAEIIEWWLTRVLIIPLAILTIRFLKYGYSYFR